MTRELAESFGLSQPEGALISSVEKGGPADKAGIAASDVILKFDGKPVASSADLPRIVAACKPGGKVLVELWRKGAVKQVTVEVARMPEEGGRVVEVAGGHAGEGWVERLGLVLTDSGRAESRSGLQVVEVAGTAAKAAGIQAGDVLLAVGNTPLRSLNQLIEIIKRVPAGRNVALLVRRGDAASYVAIRLDEK
jgi:serine protease Do